MVTTGGSSKHSLTALVGTRSPPPHPVLAAPPPPPTSGSQETSSICGWMEQNKANPYGGYDPRPPPYNAAVHGQNQYTGVNYQVSEPQHCTSIKIINEA